MYEKKPWVLEEKSVGKKTRKSAYIKNRESDLAISTSRIRELFEKNKDKAFSNSEIASSLGISLGTVSNITNRLEAIKDIKIVRVRQLRSALSQIFQHKEGNLLPVVKERGREDAIISVHYFFQENPQKIITKDDLLNNLNITEGKARCSLQILLTNGEIKLVGSTSKGSAQYQYHEGKKKGIKLYFSPDPNYSSVGKYILNNKITFKKDEILANLDSTKARLFYSSAGIIYEYPVNDIKRAIEILEKKKNNKGIIGKLFS